ncbi:MAG: glycosyltransferase family 39 protein [Candidatus Brocadiae bacterium]|nr:glycosyltransferase family 39 protein [Candidatus Brocadiia bacterium]
MQNRFHEYIEKNSKKIFLALFLLSMAIRIVYYLEVRKSPLLESHRWEERDMHFFHVWATRISQGDWLTNESFHPYHYWHRRIAQVALESSYISDEQGKELWNRWYQGKRFHQEPLYAYSIASIYWLLGSDSQKVIYYLQMVLGSMSIAILFLLAQKYFDPLTALLSSILAMMYGPFLFYETSLLRTSFHTFFNILSLWLMTLAWEKPTKRNCFYSGFVSGLSLLLAMTFMPFLLAFFIPFCWHSRRTALVFLAGVFLAVSPAIARNAFVGVPIWQMSSVGEITFIASNHPDYQPDLGWNMAQEDIVNSSKVLKKSEGKLLPSIYHTLELHPSWVSYIVLLGKKFLVLWNADEIPNNINYYYGALYSYTLSYFQVTFSVFMSFFLVGMVLNFQFFRKYHILYSFLFLNIFILSFFYCLSRFKTPFVIAMFPFAAYTIIFFAKKIWTKQYKTGISIFIFLVLLNTVSCWLTPRLKEPVHSADYILGNTTALEISRVQSRQNNIQEASLILEKCLKSTFSEELLLLARQKNPKFLFPKRLSLLLHSFGEIYLELAQLAKKSGDLEKAREYYKNYQDLVFTWK